MFWKLDVSVECMIIHVMCFTLAQSNDMDVLPQKRKAFRGYLREAYFLLLKELRAPLQSTFCTTIFSICFKNHGISFGGSLPMSHRSCVNCTVWGWALRCQLVWAQIKTDAKKNESHRNADSSTELVLQVNENPAGSQKRRFQC